MKNSFIYRVLWLVIPLLTMFYFPVLGADVTFTAGTDVNGTKTITKSSVTLTLSSGCPNLNGYSEYRIYSGASFTIECSAGITKIVVTTNTAKGDAEKLSATSGYSASGTTGTWTGDATSVTINADQGSQVRVTQIVVTPKSASCGTIPTVTASSNSSFKWINKNPHDKVGKVDKVDKVHLVLFCFCYLFTSFQRSIIQSFKC